MIIHCNGIIFRLIHNIHLIRRSQKQLLSADTRVTYDLERSSFLSLGLREKEKSSEGRDGGCVED